MTDLASPVLHRDQFIANVISNTLLCREHYKLVVAVDRFPATQPGQFVQLSCRSTDAPCDYVDHEWQPGQRPTFSDTDLLSPTAMLRRPFSLAGRRDVGGQVELDVIHRIVGIGTDWLSRLSPGDEVDVLGPLGNAFTLPTPDQTALLVGGGVGIPPMLYLATKLRDRTAVAIAGALTHDLLALTLQDKPDYPVAEFAVHGVKSIITTDDGSLGLKGRVTDALNQWLDANPTAKPVIYTCGPEPMMKAVAAIALSRKVPCQIAVERAMACGMGTCQSCCIKVKKPDPAAPPLPGSDWCYRLACTDGPVFTADQLLW